MFMGMAATRNPNTPVAAVVRVAFGWVGCATCDDGVSRAVTPNFRTEAETVAAVAGWNAR